MPLPERDRKRFYEFERRSFSVDHGAKYRLIPPV